MLYATEENLTSSCAASGRFATYDLRTSLDGGGLHRPDRVRAHAAGHLDAEDGRGRDRLRARRTTSTTAATASSAYAFYEQGVRFLDASDPRDIRQVGYYRPDGASTWAPYWYGEDYVFVADNGRGVDVLRFHDATAQEALPEVAPPPWPSAARTSWIPDPALRGALPHPARSLRVVATSASIWATRSATSSKRCSSRRRWRKSSAACRP